MTEPRFILYRFVNPEEAQRSWLSLHSLATLAAQRPGEYDVREFSADAVPGMRGEKGAILVRLVGDPVLYASRVLARPEIRAAVSAGVPIVFDDTAELGPAGAEKWQAFQHTLKQAGLPTARVLWALENERGVEDCAACFAHDKRYRVAATVFHYWMHRMRLGAGDVPAMPDRQLRERRYMLLNNRLRPHRGAMLGWLSREGLIGSGLVSVSPRGVGRKQQKWRSTDVFVAEAAAQFPGFAADIEHARGLFENGLVLEEKRAQAWQIPWHLHARSGFSLVGETEMAEAHTLRFTEKTLKALAARHPMVIAGNAGTLELLRDYGFRTFSPWIDESYDLIAPAEERLRAVLAEAKRLIAMPEEEFDRMLAEMAPVLEHNHRHFMEGLPAIMDRQHEAFRQAVVALSAAGR